MSDYCFRMGATIGQIDKGEVDGVKVIKGNGPVRPSMYRPVHTVRHLEYDEDNHTVFAELCLMGRYGPEYVAELISNFGVRDSRRDVRLTFNEHIHDGLHILDHFHKAHIALEVYSSEIRRLIHLGDFFGHSDEYELPHTKADGEVDSLVIGIRNVSGIGFSMYQPTETWYDEEFGRQDVRFALYDTKEIKPFDNEEDLRIEMQKTARDIMIGLAEDRYRNALPKRNP